MAMRRHPTQFKKLLKDYAVPLVWGILILLLFYSFFSWWDDASKQVKKENQTGLTLTLDSIDTEAYVLYSWDFKKKIEPGVALSLYKGEKVVVKSWNVAVSWDFWEANINKLWEYKYDAERTFSLISSDVWLKNNENLTISMRYATLDIWVDSVVNMSQNEVGSTIYLLKWFVEVKNLAGKNTVLAPGQKITVSRVDAAKNDIDLSLLKEELDEFFKGSDWYIKNNGAMYLEVAKTDETSSTSTQTGSVAQSVGTYLSFDNISDEQTFSETSITINGKILNDNVVKITIGEKQAEINKEEKTFSFKGVELLTKSNDIIVRAYDDAGEILSKNGFTVYINSQIVEKNNLFEVTNYSLDSKDFKFLAPKENPFTTTEWVVTIEGTVPPRLVAKIIVGDFTLTQFPKFWTYWKYHANSEFGNLNEWLNVYEVKYYGEDGKLIHTNAFSIIKKAVEASTTGSVTNP